MEKMLAVALLIRDEKKDYPGCRGPPWRERATPSPRLDARSRPSRVPFV